MAFDTFNNDYFDAGIRTAIRYSALLAQLFGKQQTLKLIDNITNLT